MVGVVLAAASIILISFGFNNLNRWGLGVARPGAPFNLFGLSPAPIMIVVGIVLLPGLHRLDAAAAGGRQNAAARSARHHLAIRSGPR